MADRRRFTALVSGEVQGVGMRRYVQRQAQDLGLAGSAENLTDGRVEIVAEGPEADLELLLVRIRKGPPHARVTDIDVTWSVPSALEGFHVW
ncbi:MAG TPA: acylphosphatase [Deinococcales bacterium]|nr:acylphosphatase [Deinococcales bacterium]